MLNEDSTECMFRCKGTEIDFNIARAISAKEDKPVEFVGFVVSVGCEINRGDYCLSVDTKRSGHRGKFY